MRIPLTRFRGDETPIAWWEFLFLPIMVPLVFIFLFIMALVSIPVEFACRLRQNRDEKQLRDRLIAVGRFIEWDEVKEKLKAGQGTLIIEHRSPKGPIREWWTEVDLVDASPVSLPKSLTSLPEDGQKQTLHDYAKLCSARYIDIEKGKAKITGVPIPWTRRIDPAKYVMVDLGGGLITAIILPTGRKLAATYPQGNVVTLIVWSDEPLLFKGDAATVFLPRE